MLLDVLKYDVVSDRAAGGAKIAPGPKMAAPVALADIRQFPLDFVRRAPLDALHEPAHRDAWWDRHEQMHVIVGQDTTDDRYALFTARLPNDLTNPLTQRTTQDFEPVLCDPHDMIAVVKNGVRGFIIGYDLSPGTECLKSPQRGIQFRETGHDFLRDAEAVRLEDGGSNPAHGN